MKKVIITLVIGVLPFALNAQSHLVFRYDAAGNQVERTFTNGASAKQLTETVALTGVATSEIIREDKLEDQIKVYPNPTQGILRLEWQTSFTKQIKRITVSQLSGITWEVPLAGREENFVEVDLTQNANGVYVVNFELQDNEVVIKKIIKN